MQKSALDQAAAIRAGVLSPEELIDSTREKIAALNPALNAITWTRFEAAKQDVNQLEDHGQPFFGVPLILKGLGQDFAGAPATFGSRFFAKAKSEHTNNFVKALQRLGFIIVGQSNVPEFGFKNITDAELYGPARNPWNHDYSPGGSS
ncbi:MAG: amidase family protein, partial [Lacticaseibacillus paracasei]